MSARAIENAVTGGVPIEYFEGDEKSMANLARFVTRRADLDARLRPRVKTHLVFPNGEPTALAVAAPVAPAEDKLSLVKKLVGKGLSFQLAADLVDADEKDIKKVDGYEAVLDALGLAKNASGKTIHEAIRANDTQ